MRCPAGYKALLSKVDLTNDYKWRKLFPGEWVDSSGRVRRSAPKSCIIFPIQMTDTGGIVDFVLSTEIKNGAPTETITPNPSDPAYVARWMGVEFDVGADLWVKSTSTLTAPITPGFILTWFFYRDSGDESEGGC